MRLYIFLTLLTFISCSEKPIFETEKSTLNQEELIVILADFHLMEAHINESGINLVTYKDSLQIFKSIVLQKHNIKEEDFNQSLAYYAQFPENYKELYSKVKDLLLEIELKLPDIEQEKNNQEVDRLERKPILKK